MKRRSFIKNSVAGMAGLSLIPSVLNSNPIYKIIPNEEFLDAADDNIMIIIELFGGNDGLNTVIPYTQEDEYMKLRPSLHIPKENSTRYGTSDLYINSALVDGIHNNGFLRLLDEGRLAIVQGIGYDSPNQSHFRSRDIWHSGVNSSDPNEKLLEGWIGRFISSRLPNYPDGIPEHPIAVALSASIPLLFKSNLGHMAIALNSPDNFAKLGAGLTPEISRFKTPVNNSYEKEFNFIHVIAEQSELYSKAVYDAYQNGKNKIKVEYSNGLSQKFKMISSLIAGGLKSKIYYVNLSNFDSHAQQMQEDYKGAHATLLAQLSSAISEFLDDAVQQGFHKRITGLTMSEFGRRAYDNGSRGTDHGAGSMQFVFAGSDEYIEGGYYRVDGKPDLFDLDQNGNIRHDYDFRRVYADFLETWLGADPKETKNVFGEQYLPLGILKQRLSSVNNSTFDVFAVNISPNPSYGLSNIQVLINKSGIYDISIFTLEGKKISDIYSGYLEFGEYNYNLNLVNSGSYFVSVTNRNQRKAFPFVISK
jgi:uncharacterized protein (DUF1501 family)